MCNFYTLYVDKDVKWLVGNKFAFYGVHFELYSVQFRDHEFGVNDLITAMYSLMYIVIYYWLSVHYGIVWEVNIPYFL